MAATQETMSAKPATPKVTEAETTQLCRLFNLTAARIGQLAKDGIIYKTGRNKYDLWRSVRGYIEFLQKSKYAASGDDQTSGIADTHAVELEGLIQQVKSARTYNDARTLKLQIEALRSGYALTVEQERYCSIPEILDAMTSIAASVRSAIMRMEADLPPMLEGMDAPAMQKTIRAKVDEIMLVIHEAGEKLTNAEPTQGTAD
jgi:phage terminase Nu1 subunit (DNA packaging protein)